MNATTASAAWRSCVGALAIAATMLIAQASSARDGVSGCSIAEAEADGKRIWRYTVELIVPQGGHCRVYVSEDLDRKSWKYCWLKDASQSPVSATCDEPLDDQTSSTGKPRRFAAASPSWPIAAASLSRTQVSCLQRPA
ncbi:hypothetical protein [Methyloceanibacter superfactus]|nr:hypothetical protein [Methyloceanibacter superfactus]